MEEEEIHLMLGIGGITSIGLLKMVEVLGFPYPKTLVLGSIIVVTIGSIIRIIWR